MDIQLNRDYLKGFIKDNEIDAIIPNINKAHDHLANKTGKGANFTGWLDLPERVTEQTLDELAAFGEEVRDRSDCIVSIGIGGSYMGIRASLEFLIADQKIPVYYAGHNLSSGYLHYLLKDLADKRVTVVVISKSGTTTEPALAFRIIKEFMEQKYKPSELKKRIICITDPKKGALRSIAEKEGYKTFPVDEDVGGRFSVLTHVGLVPLAIAGIDIHQLIAGAANACSHCSARDFDKNIASQYAASRYLLYQQGRIIEILATFYQRLAFFDEWWKQLFGESEGKDGKGIYPASLSFTADLHSMGQFIQEGPRNIFETFLLVQNSGHKLLIPSDPDNADNFNCVAGKDLDYVNKQAYKATAGAHYEGGTPSMTITLPQFDANSLGQLYYFFQKTVAITGYLLEVNPFNQPGVEAYKNKMFELLGRK